MASKTINGEGSIVQLEKDKTSYTFREYCDRYLEEREAKKAISPGNVHEFTERRLP